MEGVVAHPPGHGALLAGGAGLIGLTLDAQVHDVVPADGAVVHNDVPGPQSDGVPLLHLKPLLVLRYNSEIQFTMLTSISRWCYMNMMKLYKKDRKQNLQ